MIKKAHVNQYIDHIDKIIHPPGMCPEQDYGNIETVTHWSFRCDGTGDFSQYASDANPEEVHAYVEYCREQIRMAEEYLVSISDQSAVEWLKSLAGVFDSSDHPVKVLAVRKWMEERVTSAHEDRYDDLINYGEVNTTMLAEEAVCESPYFQGKDYNRERILEDETHWVHDIAVDVDDWYKQTKVDIND